MFGDMKLWSGIVEDRNDPLFLNRVRVRIIGIHSHDKQMIATPDLPWSDVLMPTTSPSLSGLGTTTHGLLEGSCVMGFYRNSQSLSDPVVIGSFVGIPQDFYRVDEQIDDRGTRTYTNSPRTTTEGFNDPRLDTKDSYKGTPDGENPTHINRTYGLTLALDKSPRRDGETTGEIYPKESYLKTSSVNLLARGDVSYPRIVIEDSTLLERLGIVEETQGAKELLVGEGGAEEGTRFETGETLGMNNIVGPRDDTTYINPTYPFNHVHETESGHIIELDDTPDFERIHLYHRSGTRIEIANKGDYVEKVVRDKYSVVVGNDFVNITGDVVVNIAGNAYVNTTGNTTVNTTGNTLVDTTGTTTVNSAGNTDVTTPETLITSNVKIDGTLNVTGAQTNDSTITAEGEITSGSVTLTGHTHIDTVGLGKGKTSKGSG